jgi:hypothetical protein
MKIALIPPTGNLADFRSDLIHLVLSHLLRVPEYREFYQKCQQRGEYVILDNGAHENTAGEDPDLATLIHASEMVCPDVLFEGEETVRRCQQALFAWSESEKFDRLRPHVMLVPQGHTYPEWRTCLYRLLEEYDQFAVWHPRRFWRLPVIGLSKDYEVWPGGLHRLFETDLTMLMGQDGYSVHMLGWGRDLWKLNEIARDFGAFLQLRSVDSAKPFVFARAGIRLDPNRPAPDYPRRTADYFTTSLTEEQLETAKHNVLVFRACARGTV